MKKGSIKEISIEGVGSISSLASQKQVFEKWILLNKEDGPPRLGIIAVIKRVFVSA